jgi:hypothetical protein
VWGNAEAVETRLDALGPRTSLRDLFIRQRFGLSAPAR